MPLTTSALATSLLLAQPPLAPAATATPPASAPAATSASATSPAAGEKGPADYTLAASARAWYVAPGGKITFAGSGSTKTDLSYFRADEPRIQPAGEVRIASGDWLLAIGGASAKADEQTTAPDSRRLGTTNVVKGDSLSTKLDFTSAQAVVGYKIYENAFGSEGSEMLRLYAIGGGRYSDVSLEVIRSAGGRESLAIARGEPIIGVLTELTLAEKFHIDVQLSGGGFSDSTSFDVAAVFGYRPVPWLSLEVGYRLLVSHVEQDGALGKSKLEGSYAGLLFGATFRF